MGNSCISYFHEIRSIFYTIRFLNIGLIISLHQVKFTELTLNTFRMLQCLEWEPLGSFSLTNGDDANQEGSSHIRMNPLQDIRDPSLPPNPQKVILYRPSVTHYLVVSLPLPFAV